MTEVFVEKEDQRITLSSQWFPGVSGLCKSVPGARWSATTKQWIYPLSLETCRTLRDVFTDMLVIGPELWDWAADERRAEIVLAELGSSSDAKLLLAPEVSPTLARAMAERTYQRVGARFVAEAGKRGGVGVFDEPSLGKTITTYGGIMEAGMWEGAHLVAAPKTTLKSVWADQLYRWAGETGAEAFPMPDGRAKRANVLQEFLASEAKTKFLIINPEMLAIKKGHYCKKCEAFQGSYLAEHHQLGHRTSLQIQKCDWPELFDVHWRTVTIDEVQKYLIGIRGPQKMTQVGTGATSLNADMRIALSGTPFKGVVRNLWGILHWMRPDEYKGFWSWAETYLQINDNGFGKDIGGLREGKEEAFYRSLDKVAIRRTKREVRSDLPENVWQEHWVDMLPGQKKQYTSMVEEAEADFDGTIVSTTGVLAELTRLKQLSFGEWKIVDGKLYPTEKSPKIDLLIEMLAERGVTGDPKTEFGEMKYVIASQFTQVVDCIVDSLGKRGIKSLVITGAVTGAKRAQAQKEFQSEGGARIMVINTTAGGVGIDLDAYCDEMFILDETWVPDEQKQVEGRIDNRGERVSTRFYHYIRTRETVEEGIANLNIDKDKIQSYILDKRRGVEFARKLIGRKSDG